MPRKSFRIEEDLHTRMEQFVNGLAERYNKSEVLSTAIYMYYDMFGDNPSVPDNPVIEAYLEKDKEKSKAAAWVYKLAKCGKLQKEVMINAVGLEIKIPKDAIVTYKPPNIIEFELFKGCYNQLIMNDNDCTIDENDNIHLGGIAKNTDVE